MAKGDKWPLKQLVEVEWIDSSAMGGWHKASDYEEASRRSLSCRSVGYLLKSDEDRITIMQNQADFQTGSISESMTIPAVAIRRIRKLGLSMGGKN